MSSGTRGRRRGVVLILFALSILVIFGFAGLAFDLGRLYIVRNEAQGYCDAAALAAASMLDGTLAGIAAAKAAAQSGAYFDNLTRAWKAYHFQTTGFENVRVEFATQYLASEPSSGDWTEEPATGEGYRFVRVTASGRVPMYISAVLTGQSTGNAAAFAVAAQVKKTAFEHGLVPFAPLTHCSDSGTSSLPKCTGEGAVENFGFVEGQDYALRWGANVFQQTYQQYPPTLRLDGWCSGDANANGGQYPIQLYSIWSTNPELLRTKTGFWSSLQVSGNANTYSEMILGWQGAPIEVDQTLPGFETSPPQISSIAKALDEREDRIIYAPIIDPVTAKIYGFYCFRLLSDYDPNGNQNWCATFIGSCIYGSGNDAVNQDGVYEIRLVR